MKLKTYEAPTLHAALRLARIELGSEAVLLEAKERDEETAEARFQVTFALGAEAGQLAEQQAPRLEMPHWKSYLPEAEPSPTDDKPAKPAKPAAEKPEEPEPPPAPKRRAARKKASPAAKRKRAARKPKPEPPVQPPVLPDSIGALRNPQLAAIFGRLVGAGVPPSEATALASQAAEAARSEDDASALEAALQETLDAGWLIHSAPEPAATSTRILALAGPAGAGKSATAIKAASLLIRAYDRPAVLVSLGRHPVGGVEALDAWATLLALRLEIVETPAELPAVLARLTGAPNPPGAIVLDTPANIADLSAPGLETHLVLPATHSVADLARTIERYRPLQPAAAVFTRLDEAAAPGSLWNLQRTTALPASYLGCGPDTPGDLQPATPRRLTLRLLGR